MAIPSSCARAAGAKDLPASALASAAERLPQPSEVGRLARQQAAIGAPVKKALSREAPPFAASSKRNTWLIDLVEYPPHESGLSTAAHDSEMIGTIAPVRRLVGTPQWEWTTCSSCNAYCCTTEYTGATRSGAGRRLRTPGASRSDRRQFSA